MLTDGEKGLISLQTYLQGQGIRVNPSGAGQHVPVVERKIRQIKERVRAVVNTLPYTVPESLMRYLVLFCVSRINMLPSSTRVDRTSPRELFTGRKVDYKRDLRVGFGEYVQAFNTGVQKNSLKPRTEGAIVLLPVNNLQGSITMYSMRTGAIVTRDRYTVLPMPSEVIGWLNRMAGRSGR